MKSQYSRLSAWLFAIIAIADGTLCAAQDECLNEWDPILPDATTSYVMSMTSFNDGVTTHVYAGGVFGDLQNQFWYSVGELVEGTWQPLGDEFGEAWSMTIFDDGSGPALYVGGIFNSEPPNSIHRIAKWNGKAWEPVLEQPTGFGSPVYSMVEFDDGKERALYVSGEFLLPGKPINHGVAKWNGKTWAWVGHTALYQNVLNMVVFEGDLYAAGNFDSIDGVAADGIAKWDGTQWSALPQLSEGFRAIGGLANYNSCASGPILYVTGKTEGDPDVKLAQWNGTRWLAIENIDGLQGAGEIAVLNLDGNNHPIIVFETSVVSQWDGQTLTVFEGGVELRGGSYSPGAKTLLHVGSQRALYVGGEFTSAGDVTADGFVRWVYCPSDAAIADANSDGCINAADLQIVIAAWGTCPSQPCQGDLNGSSAVDVDDLLLIINHWTG